MAEKRTLENLTDGSSCEAQEQHNTACADENNMAQQTGAVNQAGSETTWTAPASATTLNSGWTTGIAPESGSRLKVRPGVMNEDMKPWALYDLSWAVTPDALDTMQDHFRRFRRLLNKTIDGASYEALQRSWCAFIRRWNRMQEAGESVAGWLGDREALQAEHSLGDLRLKACDNAWTEDRLCYVNVREGCSSCDIGRRPTQAEWDQHIVEYPLMPTKHAWIEKYKRSLSEFTQVAIRGGSRSRRSPSPAHSTSRRARSRSRSRSLRGRSRPQRWAENRRGGIRRDLLDQDDVEQALNTSRDAQEEAERAAESSRNAEATTSSLRQSNRELLQRLRSLERRCLADRGVELFRATE
ncbi:hypothetical protein PInf_006394 [Phytophthora infestans]|nr:hypothetical protein PInf_006394 [Phytophthora infestans]